MLHLKDHQIWKAQQWSQDWKRSDFIPIPKMANAKKCSNCHTITIISHVSNLMFKILQDMFQEYRDWELPQAQAEFRKSRGTTSIGSQKNKAIPEKHALLLHWLCQSLWLCSYNKLLKAFKEMRIPEHLTCLLRNMYAGQEATVKTNMEQQTGSTFGKEYDKAVIKLCIVTLLI